MGVIGGLAANNAKLPAIGAACLRVARLGRTGAGKGEEICAEEIAASASLTGWMRFVAGNAECHVGIVVSPHLSDLPAGDTAAADMVPVAHSICARGVIGMVSARISLH